MKSVSGLSGVESVSVDMKDQKMTIIGDIDTVHIVEKLRKFCHADILSVGPAKEEKKEEKKPEEKKKDPKEELAELVKTYEAYYNINQMRLPQPHYYYTTVEESPNGCTIC
ncbi:Heavy metal-associated domain, HMA [Sesbania bispinosa]|nr:Heavy metal-associated domain, HMA [Sesbania bispinosa]